jgi:uncharacterized tellurite resistance protein B-like protein
MTAKNGAARPGHTRHGEGAVFFHLAETPLTHASRKAPSLRSEVFKSKRISRLRDRLLERGVVSEWPAATIRPESRAAYQRIRPLAEAMYLVMAADRHVSEPEREALRGAIRTLTDGVLGGVAMETMIMEFDQALARDGVDVRLDAVASVLYGDRDDMELAVALAAAVALADDRLDPEEQRTIEALAERLGIGGQRLERLLTGESDASGRPDVEQPLAGPAPTKKSG